MDFIQLSFLISPPTKKNIWSKTIGWKKKASIPQVQKYLADDAKVPMILTFVCYFANKQENNLALLHEEVLSLMEKRQTRAENINI